MTIPRFLQISTLHSYSAALLNRDDAGLAKRLPYGGATRTRISSQCLKRHWRKAEDKWALAEVGIPMGVRSKLLVERRIVEPLIHNYNIEGDIAEAIGASFRKAIYGDKAEDPKQRQAILLGEPEVEWLLGQALKIVKGASSSKDVIKLSDAFFKNRENTKNLRAMMNGAGLETALFGRMVTSDLVANTDAAIHVAHAFTVHAEESESDYFTVVDDLKRREEGDDAGSAGIFDQELTTGLYYGYVVVDVPGLVGNLEGCRREDWLAADRGLAASVVEHLMHLIATVSPGAKRGSTAPYGWAELMLVECGERQPRSLAGAFRDPVPLASATGTLDRSVEQLLGYLGKLDDVYGEGEARRLMSTVVVDKAAPERLRLPELAKWAKDGIITGNVS